jgi:hypothetical protein
MTTGDIGRLIAEAQRGKMPLKRLREEYEEIKRLIADSTPYHVVHGSVHGDTEQITMTLERK